LGSAINAQFSFEDRLTVCSVGVFRNEREVTNQEKDERKSSKNQEKCPPHAEWEGRPVICLLHAFKHNNAHATTTSDPVEEKKGQFSGGLV
jgi:hypothetical protein